LSGEVEEPAFCSAVNEQQVPPRARYRPADTVLGRDDIQLKFALRIAQVLAVLGVLCVRLMLLPVTGTIVVFRLLE
jgi:hypothetical protein